MKHTYLGTEVKYLDGMRPGDPITWDDDHLCRLCGKPTSDNIRLRDSRGHRGHGVWADPKGDDPYDHDAEPILRSGLVLERAANGVGDGREAPGWWLWVMPDDSDEPVRVRTWASGPRKGTSWRDDGPMYVRSSLGNPKIIDRGHTYAERVWYRHRSLGPCECCPATTPASSLAGG